MENPLITCVVLLETENCADKLRLSVPKEELFIAAQHFKGNEARRQMETQYFGAATWAAKEGREAEVQLEIVGIPLSKYIQEMFTGGRASAESLCTHVIDIVKEPKP